VEPVGTCKPILFDWILNQSFPHLHIVKLNVSQQTFFFVTIVELILEGGKNQNQRGMKLFFFTIPQRGRHTHVIMIFQFKFTVTIDSKAM
jgi:hypothetical protein